MSTRKFLQYELNWLKKHGFSLEDIESIGEMPVEYVTGHAQFLENEFLVTTDTLIPRIETEEIIPLALDFLSSLPTNHLNISDIGTGSGCIGISLASKLMEKDIDSFDIYLSDISPKALEVAEKNSGNILKKNQNNFHFIISNLLDKYPQNIKFDLIISNLPYIPTKRISRLDPSVKDFEPISALDGGNNGTELINNLLKTISPYLEPIFMVILEVDSTHTIDMFNIPKHFSSRIALDSFGQNRFLILTPK